NENRLPPRFPVAADCLSKHPVLRHKPQSEHRAAHGKQEPSEPSRLDESQQAGRHCESSDGVLRQHVEEFPLLLAGNAQHVVPLTRYGPAETLLSRAPRMTAMMMTM